jgi:hypothetical protein
MPANGRLLLELLQVCRFLLGWLQPVQFAHQLHRLRGDLQPRSGGLCQPVLGPSVLRRLCLPALPLRLPLLQQHRHLPFLLSCRRSLNPITGRCSSLLGYFDSGVTVSVACPPGCATCLSLTQCLTCQSGNYLSNSLCAPSCPNRFFPSTATLTCMLCPYDCLTCNSLGLCLSCDATMTSGCLRPPQEDASSRLGIFRAG